MLNGLRERKLLVETGSGGEGRWRAGDWRR
jgi:hypothetical protein